MPVLETPDGKPVAVTPVDAEAVNREFDRVMNDDGPDEQAPPRRQKPAGEDAAKPRRGRPPKEEKARATDKPAAPVKDDYTADAQQAVGKVWAVMACLPPTQAYALVVEGNSDALAAALAEGAKHNETVRRFVAQGGNSWMLQLAGVGLTMGMQTYQLMRDPQLRREAAATTREHLKAAMAAQGIKVPEPAAA